MNEKLCLAPKNESAKRVLDIGTGTGVWAIDYGEFLPRTPWHRMEQWFWGHLRVLTSAAADEHPEAEVNSGRDVTPSRERMLFLNLAFR